MRGFEVSEADAQRVWGDFLERFLAAHAANAELPVAAAAACLLVCHARAHHNGPALTQFTPRVGRAAIAALARPGM